MKKLPSPDPAAAKNQLDMEQSPRLTKQTPPPPPPPPLLPTAINHRVPLPNPSVQSTWSHRSWVAIGCINVAISMVKCITAAIDSGTWVQPILAGWVGYIMADLSTGIYHWAIDNYGCATTPVLGSQIQDFQTHHKFPWIFTQRQFAFNLHLVAQGITFGLLPVNFFFRDGPILHGFFAAYSGFVLFSEQFHSWAHDSKSRLPRPVVALQDAGVLLSRSHHAAHHRPPHNKNYCIVSGVWNELLEEHKVFETVETAVFYMFGVRPRCWSESNSEWTREKSEINLPS